MQKDFYLNDLSQAAYFEKDWFDHAAKAQSSRFAFASFELADLYSPYHERLAGFVAGEVTSPARVLEIGSSTGRTFYELCRNLDSIRSATLVEPSANLFAIFSKIFGPDKKVVEYFPALKGNVELVEVAMDTSAIRAASAQVDIQLLNLPYQQVSSDLGQFDLVVCSNVIDQCDDPLELVELLKRSVAPGGLMALSCTYQWQEKYKGLPAKTIRHLDELFGEDWQIRGESNIPFQLRVNERHWKSFLSHVCLFRKQANG